MRRGDALGLTWNRADRARGVVSIDVTKNDELREAKLNSTADGVLARRWTPGATGYVFGSRKWNNFRSALEFALAAPAITGFRFHDLRHTCASWLVQRGRPLKEVQDVLGIAR